MTMITSGLNWENKPCTFSIEKDLLKNLKKVKEVVLTKDFDFVSVVAGYPGTGKSNFAITIAKYFDPNFTIKNICFTADQFIELSSNCERHSAVILDESFASLNSKISMSSDFLRIVNHLQLIRQKNLFILLCLPNFFDLQKSIALYRSSWLIVVYSEEFGSRGTYACFDREGKKYLYIKGMKFLNYKSQTPNFFGRFFRQKVIDDTAYEKLKIENLKMRENIKPKYLRQRDILINYMKNENDIPVKKIGELIDTSSVGIYKILAK